MSEPADQDQAALNYALFAYDVGRIRALQESGRRLAHYTTAEVAQSIIAKAEIWMRNVQVMNDFSEVQHGLACIAYAREQGLIGQLFETVNNAHPGLEVEIVNHFGGWMNAIQYDTYLTCLSEFAAPILPEGSPDPDHEYGRLSMWRAYGGDNGVALIVDPAFLTEGGDIGNVYASPVYYGDPIAFAAQFAGVVARMRAIPEVLKRCDRGALRDHVFNALCFAVLATKHPAFKEEEEWRVIYTPLRGESRYVNKSVKNVRGVPQVIHTLQLVDDAPNNVRLAPKGLIENVLIGPCQFPMTLRQTFFDTLMAAGVPDPNARIRTSGIPLRR